MNKQNRIIEWLLKGVVARTYLVRIIVRHKKSKEELNNECVYVCS